MKVLGQQTSSLISVVVISISINCIFILFLFIVVPSLSLSVSSIELSDRSTDQQMVQCFLKNSPQPGLTPFWVDKNRQIVSNNKFLTVSFATFPNSMQFFCLANISSSTIEIGLNYTVLVTDSVLDAILNVNSEVSGSQAVDLSGQISVIANGNISVGQTNQLLDAIVNLLSFTNTSTLTDETAGELTVAVLNTVSSISTRTNNQPSINTTSQENIGNNIANTLSTLVDVINMLPVSIVDPIIQVVPDGSMLLSQIFSSVTDPVDITLGSISIVVPPGLFQSFNGPTRITTLLSNSLNSFPALLAGSESALIAGSVNSISIQGINGNDIINPPIVITSTVSGVSPGRVLVCSFWDVTSQSWESTGVTTVLGDADGEVACQTTHLTSFAVLTVAESTAANLLPLKIVSYILLSLSLISLLISLILFILSGRRFFDVEMNRMYFNYALALTLAISSFIFGVNLGVLNNIWCIISTILVHYFWLSVFTWGLSIAVLISYLMTLGVLNRKALFWPLFVLAWILPIPIVLITMIIGLVRGNYVILNENCFLSLGYIWSLIGPIIVIIVLTIIGLFIAIARVIQLSFRKIGNGKKHILTAVKRPLIAACILLPILGIPWIVILSDFFIDTSNKLTTLFEWIFLILIGPSGVVFLLSFTLPNQAVRKTLCCKISPKDSMKRKLSSLPQAKTKTDIELENLVETPLSVVYSNQPSVDAN